MLTLSPDPVQRGRIESAAHTTSHMCWTCGSCDYECPVNIATGRLRPQKLVRMANLGLLGGLLELPEIWYCLACRRCLQICPNAVKPSVLIEFLRKEAVRRHLVTVDMLRDHKMLFARFQRIRWHATVACLQGEPETFTHRRWCDWLEGSVPGSTRQIPHKDLFHGSADFRSETDVSRMTACFTCGECSSACPVSCERSVFDPRTVFRMVNLGLMEALLTSPSIWLCISCGRCTDACSQLVDGRRMLTKLQKMAIDSGAVDRGFPLRLERINKMIYARFLDEIDGLFGFTEPDLKEAGCTERVLHAAAF